MHRHGSRMPFSGRVGLLVRLLVVLVSAALVMSMVEGVVAAPAIAAPAPKATSPAPQVTSRPDRVSALLAARAQGSRVKVDGEGSSRSETWANPDGSLSVDSYAQPTFRRSGESRDGSHWVPLASDLSGSGTSASPYVAAGLPRIVTFGQTASQLFGIDLPGGQISFSAPGLNLGPARVSGSSLTFSNVASNTDLQLDVSPAGIKTNLVLKSALAPTSFRFHVSDPRSLVGTPAQQSDGSYKFDKDLGDGWQMGLAPATAYVPADLGDLGAGVDVSSATQVVTRVGDGWDIVLAVVPQWLTGRSFPVVLDPSPVFLAGGTTGADCDLASGTSATTSFCSAATRDIGFNSSKIRRTLVEFDTSSIPSGVTVLGADLDLYLATTEAATGPVPVQVFRTTQLWTPGATWNKATSSFPWTTAGGAYDSGTVLATTTVGTTAGHYHWAVLNSAVQNWLSSPSSNFGLLLRATSETTTGVLRFASGHAADASQQPRLTITYNTAPKTPSSRSVTPCASQCSTTPCLGSSCGPPVLTSSLTPELSQTANDADGDTLEFDFEVWDGAGTPTTLISSGSATGVPNGAVGKWKVPSGALNNGTTYKFRDRAYDGIAFSNWSGWTPFKPDITAPSTPALTSTSYADGGWGAPSAGSISYTSSDTNGIAGYSTQLDDEEWSAFGTATSRSFTNLTEGLHTFSVRAQDKAGGLSSTQMWTIGVNVGGISSPSAEAQTAARVSLQASAQAGRDWMTWQFQLGTGGSFADVPLTDVTIPGTSTHPSSWPVQRSSGALPPFVWDVGTTAGPDGLVQLRACFGTSSADPSPFCTAGRNVQLSRATGSYATEAAGPGLVSQLTGDMSLSESDVDVPSYNGSLTIGRTLTTLAPSTATAGAGGIFGPAWTASLPGPETGAAGRTVLDKSTNGFIALVRDDGTQDIYVQQSSSGSTTTFTGLGETGAAGSVLVKDTAPTPDTLTLTELNATTTVWALSGTTWSISSVTEPGASTTSYTHDGSGRVTQILAPVPTGVTCTTPLTTAGCRTLNLIYAATTTATGTAPAQWGDFTGRLSRVDFTAFDPAAAAMTTTPVASYFYDSAGLLRSSWDPRITPALKTTYAYGAANRLTSVTPPGLATWSFGYDSANRLTGVSRPNPAGGTQTTTVSYTVPFTGAGAPVDLDKTETDKWGQSDLPATATAIWRPDHVPAATPSAVDWQYANLTYLDVNGRAVNTASWGDSAWQVTTTEYDKRGNTVRSLSASNRNDALTPVSNPDLDPYVASIASSATRADLLSDLTIYSSDGVDQVGALESTHPVVLDDGSIVSARRHTSSTFDQGAPGSGGPYRLPTTNTAAAQTPDGVDHDARNTLTGYDPIVAGDPSGWTLRQATTTTTDMPGSTPDIVKTTRYNAVGQTIETRMPSEPTGGGAGSSQTTYYSATGSGTCGGKAYWAGLICQTTPVAQPSSGPLLPSITLTYNLWGNPLTTTETAGTTTRTTTTSYDGAGRSAGQAITVSPTADGGTPVPPVATAYDTATGLPTTTTSSAGDITVGYDAVGEPNSYTQTSGGLTITAATKTYDIAGRVSEPSRV